MDIKVMLTYEQWELAKAIVQDKRDGLANVIASCVVLNEKPPVIGRLSEQYRHINGLHDALFKESEWTS